MKLLPMKKEHAEQFLQQLQKLGTPPLGQY
jgi:hypothetical protein